MKKNNPIYLRAHHLLCLQGYQGYGYDEKFKKNMDKVFYQLNINNNKNNYNTTDNNEDNRDNKDNGNKDNDKCIKNIIILTDYPDDLCNYCPNLIDDKCAGEINDLKSAEENTEKINSNNEKIVKMDQLVLQKAKLKKNIEYSVDESILAVNKVFYNIEQAKKVCGNCKWENECLWLQSKNLKVDF